MNTWRVDMKDGSAVDVDAERMETCSDGAIEFVNDEKKGPKIVKRIKVTDWQCVVKG